MSRQPSSPEHGATGLLALIVRLAAVALIAWGLLQATDWAMVRFDAFEQKPGTAALTGMILGGLFAYAVLLAIPFVPGVELGLALLLMQGADVAPFVYAATVLGLTTAYLAGRFLPLGALQALLRDIGLGRASALVGRMRQRTRAEQLEALRLSVPRWVPEGTLSYRYVMIAVLLNVPGNWVVGGGGGILLASGASRLFSTPLTVLTVMIAVLPVPLLIWLFGPGLLTQLFGPDFGA